MATINVYQTDNRNLCFMRMSFLKKMGLEKEIVKKNYKKVYEREQKIENMKDLNSVLEDLFRELNINHPSDYKGRSLSVSDVVEININNSTLAYLCDDFGFKLLSNF